MPVSVGLCGADFADLLDLVVADEGFVVALAAVYVDESGTHDSSPVMSVGGFIFKKRKASEFSRRWGAYLRAKDVPYFHMAEVNSVGPHGVVYDGAARGASGVAQRAAGVPVGGHRQSSVEVRVVRPGP